jgi:cytochrome c5
MQFAGSLRSRRATVLHDCRLMVFAFVVAQVGFVPAHADEAAIAAVLERGSAVYRDKCFSCHGENGRGTPDVPAPLFGDRATADLADVIDRTMPDGAPEDCAGDDARAVAEWMQSAFYSPEAQARLNPPQRSFSRLTVMQHRNAIADLGLSFQWTPSRGTERGLKAEYYADRRSRRDKRVIERVDANVDFDYQAGSPDAEKIPPEEFSMEWNGSLIPRETGWYEFSIVTPNAARLFVNDRQEPLIDAWVRSGPETVFHGSRFLLAGRMYPLRLEWFKFKEPTGAVSLHWTPPFGVDEPIPTANLSPEWVPEVIVVETPFPPDDRSDGYERGVSVSREWFDAATQAAIEASGKFVANREELLPIKDGEDVRTQYREFAASFVERAFRRPLDGELKQAYVDQVFEQTPDSDEALRRIVLLTLSSPRFLYCEPTGSNDGFDRAVRLSLALTNSIPDMELLTAAREGRLESDEQLREQAWRLVNTDRARSHLLEFLRRWMNLDRMTELSKDPVKFPEFTPRIAADLRNSLELLLEQTVDAEPADLRLLLLNDQTYMNGRLAKFYGVELPEDAGYRPVSFESDHRAGILTHPYLLSGFAYTQASSPIHRGVFLSRSVLGRGVKPPPEAVAPTAPDLAPELTTRERVEVQTSPQMCANCHSLINSLGFALENFDAVGRYRDSEKGKPIDASGQYLQRNSELIRFTGAKELAGFLARSDETRRSLARQLFHHMVQQPVLAFGPQSIGELSDFLGQHDYNVKHLMVEIACRAATPLHAASDQPVVAAGRESIP